LFVQTCTCRFSTFKYYSRIHQTFSGKVGLKFNLSRHFQTYLLFIYIVPKFLKFCNQFIINSKKGTMLLFSIYFLLLLSKTKPFFDYFGDNYFFCLLYHAFTPSYICPFPLLAMFLHCIMQHPFSSNLLPPCHLHYHGVDLHSLAPNLLPCDQCPIDHQLIIFVRAHCFRGLPFLWHGHVAPLLLELLGLH
jgi:hypothetical protein